MKNQLRNDAEQIIKAAIDAVQPDSAVRRALKGKTFPGKIVLVAIGKAAWQMANAAYGCLGQQIHGGIVITKYHHVKGPIGNLICWEAGHPVPDENSIAGTKQALELIHGLTQQDTVLFLVSGGGSALFELPLISDAELQDLNRQLLRCGADIVEINTIRKRISAVKGGRFAELCCPAHVFSIVLSDILGDPLDMIASGPACPDHATCEQALSIVEKYQLDCSDAVITCLKQETPKELRNVSTVITGSVRALCQAAENACQRLGYDTTVLTDRLYCQAKEAGSFLSSIVKTHADTDKPLAFLAGGETVVQLTGHGKGGRNQELALAAAAGIDGLYHSAIFSVGSDGTDGPTDAAGGYADGYTAQALKDQHIDLFDVLRNNDAYHALQKTDGLIFTGPTGTNVNDIAVCLIRPSVTI